MFWQRFYDICLKHGTKPNPVAKEIGISSGILTKWKNTGALPNGETLIKLADYFDCSVDYLLGRHLSSSSLTPSQQRLVEFSKSLTDEEVEKVLNIIQFVLSERNV